MRDLIEANVHFLGQAKSLLQMLDDGAYAKSDEVNDRASIGQHIRHCLDHYLSFLKGLPERAIDYNERERAENVECLTDCALGILQEIQKGLANLKQGIVRKEVKVRMDCGEEETGWQKSTIGRELQFLVGHTVHHYAMISGIAREHGVNLGAEFGIAPSTLKYRKMLNID